MSIFLLTVGISGIFLLVSQISVSSQLTQARLEAVYLAQEGIEIARNFRDNNFLRIYDGQAATWLDGLDFCNLGCEADFNDEALIVFDNRFLKIGGGFYNYETGPNTSFKRKIIITDLENNPLDDLTESIKISVEVSWRERGRDHKVDAQEYLYKW